MPVCARRGSFTCKNHALPIELFEPIEIQAPDFAAALPAVVLRAGNIKLKILRAVMADY